MSGHVAMLVPRRSRVLIIGYYPPPFGGQSVHVRDLSAFLRSRGLEVKVLNIGPGRKQRSKDCIGARNVFEFALRLMAFAIRGYAFHLHTDGHSRKSWLVILLTTLVSRILRKTIFVTLHSGMCPDYIKSRSGSTKMVIKRALNSLAGVISVNTEIREALLEVGVRTDKVKVIEAFSLLNDLSSGNLPSGIEAFLNSHKPIITCVGFAQPEYGLSLLGGLADRLSLRYDRVGIVVIGVDAPSEGEGFTNHKAITWIGNQERSTALLLIGKSDVFVRPTLKDGDAISVREALALNVPVVASDVVFRPNGAIIFKVGDVEEFSLRVERALEKPRPRMASENSSHIQNLLRVIETYRGSGIDVAHN